MLTRAGGCDWASAYGPRPSVQGFNQAAGDFRGGGLGVDPPRDGASRHRGKVKQVGDQRDKARVYDRA